MCYINWDPEMWEYDAISPGPRPSPRLAWSLPVDVVELGVSLEAFSTQLTQNTTLRLCHRFGHGSLTTLPQEILDQIISHAHETMKATLRGKWEQNYLCFQSRCSRYHHHNEYWRPDIQDPKVAAAWFRAIRPDEKLEDFTDEGYLMLPEELTESDDEDCEPEWVWDVHKERQGEWLNQLCLCHGASSSSRAEPGFLPLYKLLKSHFGLEAIIQHEVLSSDLESFLPYPPGYGHCAYYTSCFLALPSPAQVEGLSAGRLATHRNGSYLSTDNHLAYQKIIQPYELAITAEQKLRFARAMRVLGVDPYYPITELELIIATDKGDKAFWAICNQQISGRPKISTKSRWKKRKLLNDYLRGRNKELSQLAWPQLMLMSTSDAVGPSR
ncbi:hypothetical protein DE146DRAFT_514899 [Phaeosphaeria sp. MPI-PUGE-AT-0046c]|nr:hypothetical protein DE146DRAFT_514899 [Phaeosphaeria sp. MPI-PUGE-AT-0046c]